MIVRVDGHGERVGGAGDGVRRLQHLAGVERMRVGIVVVENLGGVVEDGGGLRAQVRLRTGRQVREAAVQMPLGIGEELKEVVGLEI